MGPAFGRPSVLLITVAVCLLSRSHLSSSDPKPATATSTERCGGLSSDSESVLAESYRRWHDRQLQKGRTPLVEQNAFLLGAACLLHDVRDPYLGSRDLPGTAQLGPGQGAGTGLPEGSAVRVEIGQLGSTRQSTTAGHLRLVCPAEAATNGLTLGFDPAVASSESAQDLSSKYPVAKTEEEAEPWWRLDLSEPSLVTSVEAWWPRSADEAVRADIMEANSHKQVGSRQHLAHKAGSGRNAPGKADTTLAASLWTQGNALVWEGELPPVYTWRASGLEAGASRLMLRPVAGGRRLALAEVQVHAVVPWECERYCRHGSCLCATPNGSIKQPAGSCIRTVCMCEPDWAGLQCDTFVRSAWDYLPPSLPPPGHLDPMGWWDAGGLSSRLSEMISERQHPRSCPQRVAYYGDLMQSGLGSTLMLMSAALSDSLVQGHTFLPPEQSLFAASARNCKGRRGFDCYFKPWTTLDSSCMSAAAHPPGGTENRVGGTACSNEEATCSRMNVVPGPFAGQGRTWYRSHLMAYLMQPNKLFWRNLELEATKQRIGFQNPIIGLHVRHGDSCFLARSGYCRPVDDYLPAIRSAAARYNISRVFVATDDPAVVTSLKARKGTGLTWVFVPMNRDVFDVSKPVKGSGWKMSVEKRIRRGELPVYETTLSTVRDVMLLAHADVLIGTGSASFFKLALLLSTAVKRAIPPYVSLDSAYCDSWRMCCDVMPDGSSKTC